MSLQLANRVLARRSVNRSTGITGGLLFICLLAAAGAMPGNDQPAAHASASTVSLNSAVNNSTDGTPGGLASDAEINIPSDVDGTAGSTTGTGESGNSNSAGTTTVSITTTSDQSNGDGAASTQVSVNGQPITPGKTKTITSADGQKTVISASTDSSQSGTASDGNDNHTSSHLHIHSSSTSISVNDQEDY